MFGNSLTTNTVYEFKYFLGTQYYFPKACKELKSLSDEAKENFISKQQVIDCFDDVEAGLESIIELSQEIFNGVSADNTFKDSEGNLINPSIVHMSISVLETDLREIEKLGGQFFLASPEDLGDLKPENFTKLKKQVTKIGKLANSLYKIAVNAQSQLMISGFNLDSSCFLQELPKELLAKILTSRFSSS